MKNPITPTVTSEVRAEQAASAQAEAIYLGLDLHKATISVTRIIDHGTPQPAQRFDWDGCWRFLVKQLTLAKKVYAVYESGAFGFWLCRKLQQAGIECYVTHPQKLDPQHKHVQTDKLDSRHLADNLQRFVRGNQRAMVSVYVPTEQEEQERLESRHREALRRQLQTLKARGRGLLLSQGVFDTQGWWRPARWIELQQGLCAQLVQALEDNRALIADLEKRVHAMDKKLKDSAPPQLPKGFGQLTYVLLGREICNYQRFGTRRNVGGFTGLCGAVSSSGPSHQDLSINKAGSPYLRTLLIELAWRMVYWQPDYAARRGWRRLALGSGPRTKRRVKIAVVALAHQLMVDLWRWQTGRVQPEQLGWQMNAA